MQISELASQRKALREAYGDLYDRTEALFFECDPVGLNFGDNQDEYAPEVDAILPRLNACAAAADVTDVVHQEFVRLFDEQTAGPRKHYEAIGSDLWRLWQDFTARSAGA